MKALFFLLIICSHVDVVEGRRLELDVALDNMRKRLEAAATSTELESIENFTENPMLTYVTSTAVSDASVGVFVTPAMLPAETSTDIHSHSSIVRAVLNRISRECTWGDERCADLEAAVELILNRATLSKGPAEPSLMIVAASVVSVVVCISLVIGGLTGLVLLLDRFLPSEAVYDGLSVVGHSVMHCVNGVWRFLSRRRRAREQVVEPMVARADGGPRPMAVVVPEQAVEGPGAVVHPALYPAVFQVILLVYSYIILEEGLNHILVVLPFY